MVSAIALEKGVSFCVSEGMTMMVGNEGKSSAGSKAEGVFSDERVVFPSIWA
jgi:hypothetical protein